MRPPFYCCLPCGPRSRCAASTHLDATFKRMYDTGHSIARIAALTGADISAVRAGLRRSYQKSDRVEGL